MFCVRVGGEFVTFSVVFVVASAGAKLVMIISKTIMDLLILL